MITDVEGSTAVWEWDPELMNAALSLHDKLIRALIDKYHGMEVTTEGDAFIIAFHEPQDAVMWCMHIQDALVDVNWDSKLLRHQNTCEQTVDTILTAYANSFPDDEKKVYTCINDLTLAQKVRSFLIPQHR